MFKNVDPDIITFRYFQIYISVRSRRKNIFRGEI